MTQMLGSLVVPTLASAPSSPIVGQVYYNTQDGNMYVYDGTWVDLTTQGGSSGASFVSQAKWGTD